MNVEAPNSGVRKIKFKGQEFILIGEEDGAIAFLEEYRHGRPSYAHLYPSGIVKRFGKAIGIKHDVEFGEFIPHPEIHDDWFDNAFDDNLWSKPAGESR